MIYQGQFVSIVLILMKIELSLHMICTNGKRKAYRRKEFKQPLANLNQTSLYANKSKIKLEIVFVPVTLVEKLVALFRNIPARHLPLQMSIYL